MDVESPGDLVQLNVDTALYVGKLDLTHSGRSNLGLSSVIFQS